MQVLAVPCLLAPFLEMTPVCIPLMGRASMMHICHVELYKCGFALVSLLACNSFAPFLLSRQRSVSAAHNIY
jgi:hypothetical protein